MDTARLADDTAQHPTKLRAGMRVSELVGAAASRGLTLSEVLSVKRGYTVKEAAEYLGCGVSTVRQLIRDNTLPAKKQGTKTLLDVRHLDAYFDALPEVA